MSAQLPTAWRDALAERERHHDLRNPDLCVRLLHGEDEAVRCDRFGQTCWFYRYRPISTTRPASPATDRACFDELTRAAGARHWHAHDMLDRGRDPQAAPHTSSAGAPAVWTGCENNLRFQLRATSGQSPGLFLDQRANRAWVQRHARDAHVLNLFAYTGSFGVAALAGGAAQVVQVDTSQPYLDWARTNATENGLPPERLEHSAVDARLFLQGCRKRGRRFQGIICDPPSFGRARGRRSRVFRIERDLPDLISACVELVDPGGWILVSSNYEGWSQASFEGIVRAAGNGHNSDRRSDQHTTVSPAPGAGSDFVAGGASPLLKSCILRVG